jgi:outer membrane protein assembly factor BamB
MMRKLLLGGALLLLTGCGLRDYVFDLMEGEENSEKPAALVDFAPGAVVAELWSASVGHGTEKQFLKLQPVALEGKIFTAERAGEVHAIDEESGKRAWEKDLDVQITGGPGVGEQLVLVGTGDGEVIALKQDDGSIAWRSSVSSEVLAAPKAAEGTVVVRTLDGKIFGLDASNGNRLWTYDRQVPVLTLRGTSAPVLVRGLAIAGFDSGNLVALELKTGKVAWEANVAPPRGRSEFDRMVDIDAEPLVVDGTLYVAAFQHGVIAVSLESGRIEWTKDLSSYAGISVDRSNVYLSDDKGQVWALDRDSGRAVWKQDKLAARAVTAPAVVDDYVVVGDLEGYLHWLSKEDGQFMARVRIDKSALIAAPFSVSGKLYAYSSAGTLGAYHVTGTLDRPEPTPEATASEESKDEAKTADDESEKKAEKDADQESKPATDDATAAKPEQEPTPAESDTKSTEPTAAKGAASEQKTEQTQTPPGSQDPAPAETPRRRGPAPSMRSSDWLYP